jgi:alkanesulfonate monooxygenase SsuD/methylene tetrahydromethanopterin reductase-like flavin-dependent oxidoreductase (luciferase family)
MKVGLMLPIGQQELLAGPDRWSLFRDMTLAAEASGLDSVWCAGMSHVIAHVWPRTPEAVARLGAVAAMARERLGAAVG